MENPRPEKVAVVDEVRERLDSASAALLTEYRGLDVAAISALRRELRKVGGEYKIYKNTLVRFAARDLGLELEDLLIPAPRHACDDEVVLPEVGLLRRLVRRTA